MKQYATIKMKIHHITKSKDEFCNNCKEPMGLYWLDKAELYGFSEMFFDGYCEPCYKAIYKEMPKTLQQLNKERSK